MGLSKDATLNYSLGVEMSMSLNSRIENLRVLLIEEDFLQADLVKKCLASHLRLHKNIHHIQSVYELKNQKNGEKYFDVVLLDVKPSYLSPEKKLEKVLEWNRFFPIVVLTDYENVDLGLTLLHRGAQDYLCKSDLTSDHLARAIINSIERKNCQLEMQKAKDNADAASKEKSIFLANMSHEIRTPLGVLLGFSDLLVSEKLSQEERIEYVEAMQRNGKLLKNLVEDILDISKIESGRLQLKIERANLREVISQVNHDFMPRIKAKGLTFTIEVEENIPKFINTDLVRLMQIFYNLLGNAIKYTESGGIRLHVRCDHGPSCFVSAKESSCEKIIFSIYDSGVGILKEDQSQIFQNFNQILKNQGIYSGVGLGLVISKKLAQLMGGDVLLKWSEVGQGSLFEISILSNLHKEEGFVLKEEYAKSNEYKRQEIGHIKVLLAEDSKDNQLIIKKFLTSKAYDVDIVSDGAEACEVVNHNKYDLILMDLRMPKMDGYTAAYNLRKNGYLNPIIALTALAFDQERENCLKNGFNDFITKPIDKEVLFKTIEKWI